jgi:hypothetical protein
MRLIGTHGPRYRSGTAQRAPMMDEVGFERASTSLRGRSGPRVAEHFRTRQTRPLHIGSVHRVLDTAAALSHAMYLWLRENAGR